MSSYLAKRLHDAKSACRTILEFTKGVEWTSYERNRMLQSAVERQLEILGEALHLAAQEDESLIERIPELRRIVGMRNRLIHGYDTVDHEIVWDVVIRWIAPLRDQLDSLLADEIG